MALMISHSDGSPLPSSLFIKHVLGAIHLLIHSYMYTLIFITKKIQGLDGVLLGLKNW